ncbi:MAG: hypothetical protein KDK70_36895, partial [Myxococcales bacterium]|nr:hypothetical protein [Myxococcales bacterium]
MGRALFTRCLDGPHGRAEPHRRGVHVGGSFASWASLVERGRALARAAELRSGGCYLVDPSAGLDSFAALLAVAQTPGTALLWARSEAVAQPLQPRGPALWACTEPPGTTP